MRIPCLCPLCGLSHPFDPDALGMRRRRGRRRPRGPCGPHGLGVHVVSIHSQRIQVRRRKGTLRDSNGHKVVLLQIGARRTRANLQPILEDYILLVLAIRIRYRIYIYRVIENKRAP